MFGAGSDNDSLHSSTSSLEYAGGGSKLLSYPSPRTPEEYPPHNAHQQPINANFNHTKFSQESKPTSDLHNPNGDAGGAVGRSGASEHLSPGFKFVSANANANSTWNGRFRSNGSFGEEIHSFNNHSPKPATPASPRKTPQLNKFPLDLDSIVTGPSVPPETMSPRTAVPPPRSPGSGMVSSSASLSSLESSDIPPLYPPVTPPPVFTPVTPPGPQRVPRVSPCPVPLSPAQTPRLQLLSGPQVGQVDSVSFPRSPMSSQGDKEDELGDSVGSILQRIASFSQAALHTSTNTTSGLPGQMIQPPAPQGPQGPQGQSKDSAGDLERDVPMEDTEATPTAISTAPSTTTPPTTNGSRSEPGHDGQGQEHTEQRAVIMSVLDENHTHGPAQDSEGPAVDSEGPRDTRTQHPENGVHPDPQTPHCPSPDPDMSYISGADLFGYVGIEAVLDQMRRKTMKAGFEFNVMVVGQSGLGKSTLVNTLFKSRVSRKSCSSLHHEKIPKTVRIHAVSHMIEEKGVKMKLTVVDTPGFGDHINNNNCWEPIVAYVQEQYEKYLREELNVTRKRRIPDTRVHCCVYFLPPTGHRLRAIDVEFMKHLGSIVSIVPVIAKADTLTLDERLDFKHRIRQDLAANGIQVYPQKEYDEDPEESVLNNSIRECIPFAVVGTDREHQVNGNKVLGRKTKWGIIEVENAAHCEFSHLRDLLIRSHLQDLKDVTHNILYETYRVRRLNQANVDFSELGLPSSGSPLCSSLCSTLCSGIQDPSEGESQL
ncbi:septin-9-like isoform X1 [Boleophthalmus pectinirostris]|uniref:septin-9-like isoform X1 n=2 Tax=Boleophthalmus pectinirostris TaxID=150288 RepID=UPI0024314C12|nr:septin-9-like isoform X1 [Boleophthalmus pectinirostris]